MRKCGLCGKEIMDDRYFTIYQCKGAESRLVLVVCSRDFCDERYRDIITKISSI